MATNIETATALAPASTTLAAGLRHRLPPVPWRDPHTVSPTELLATIQTLERSCLENPESADLRTCLGMAYAMNYEVYKSMDALQEATAADPEHFWAQYKYAELHYLLRALPAAEEETLKALELAQNTWELNLARKQLKEIRRLRREGTRDVAWTKPLTAPALILAAVFVVLFVTEFWR